MIETSSTMLSLLDAVNGGHLLASPRTDSLTTQTTVEDALKRMTELHVQAMLVREPTRSRTG
jgi:hypothetical protein